MKIFDKRPLCMILCILLGGFVFFTDSSNVIKVITLIISAICLILFQFILKKNSRRFIASIALIALIFSSLLSFIYYDCYFNVYNHYRERVEIVANVTDAANSDYGASVYLECESINGNPSTQKLYAYIDKECTDSVDSNTTVRFSALLKDFEDDGDYHDRGYMRSMGYSAEAYDISDFSVIDVNTPSLSDRISEYRTAICNYILANSGEEGGGLLCALLLGERHHLPFQAKLSFKRLGLSHMLALSGLHLTIITFAISFVLSLLKIRKKPRKVIEIIFVILYSILTGMPISVVRAALMHIIASVIFLCAAKSDSITTLSISVTAICCVIPYAIYDVSLWLSAFATLGVLVYSELYNLKFENNKTSLLKKILTGFLGGIAVSLFAIGTTYLISVISFRETSLIGALITPIASFFITPFMYLGLVFLPLAFLSPLGAILNSYGNFICNLTKAISSFSDIYVSAENIVTICLLTLFSIAVTLFLVLDIKKRRYPLLILLVLFVATNASAGIANIINKSIDDTVYFCDTDDEYFLIKSRCSTYFIDISSGSVSDSYSALNYISSEKITEISGYVFTSYTKNTVSSALKMASSILIKEIYLPAPETQNEKTAYADLKQNFEGSYTNLKTYTTSDILTIGSYQAIFPYRSMLSNKCAFLLIDPDSYITCYTSSGMLNDDTKNVASEMISMSDRLILGRHGESYNNKYFIFEFEDIDEIVVSNKDLILPNEVLNYYRNTTITPSRERMSLKR